MYFEHYPNATMIAVEPIVTNSFIECLHSVGGIQVLLPLFAQFNRADDGSSALRRPVAYATLLSLLCSLIRASSVLRDQMMQIDGFLVLGFLFEQVGIG